MIPFPLSPRPWALILCASLLPPACKNNDSDGDDPTPSQAEYFFTGNLDGQTLRFEIDASGQHELTTSNGGSIGPPDCTFDYGCGIGAYDPGDTYAGVSFPGLFTGDCGDEGTEFSGLFHLGSYTYGTNTGQVSIQYFDGQELWTTGGGPQSNATFEITKSERVETFGVSQKVGGKASCTLYNDAGSSKQLTDVQFVLSFSPWF